MSQTRTHNTAGRTSTPVSASPAASRTSRRKAPRPAAAPPDQNARAHWEAREPPNHRHAQMRAGLRQHRNRETQQAERPAFMIGPVRGLRHRHRGAAARHDSAAGPTAGEALHGKAAADPVETDTDAHPAQLQNHQTGNTGTGKRANVESDQKLPERPSDTHPARAGNSQPPTTPRPGTAPPATPGRQRSPPRRQLDGYEAGTARFPCKWIKPRTRQTATAQPRPRAPRQVELSHHSSLLDHPEPGTESVTLTHPGYSPCPWSVCAQVRRGFGGSVTGRATGARNANSQPMRSSRSPDGKSRRREGP